METLFQNDYAILTYEEELKALSITWINKKNVV
jgi:hypothetical protein